ncbi:hypothetical protein [Sulfitobacter noctilucicola]|uniref:Uncharacterized protein n=1 Tax=Sulfitobacter noctilucicola TaxID=1342301 RepID=A0A7W6Q5H1_9RHOB|nr:hypothetical protein [Sulfitobacter noctilucicola]MBB4173755.1 hypothetical protein [Sulfitobacter noctilucicola]
MKSAIFVAAFATCAFINTVCADTTGSIVGATENAAYPIAVQGADGVLYSCRGTHPRLQCTSSGGGMFSSGGLSAGALVGLGLVSIAIVGVVADSDDTPEANGTN